MRTAFKGETQANHKSLDYNKLFGWKWLEPTSLRTFTGKSETLLKSAAFERLQPHNDEVRLAVVPASLTESMFDGPRSAPMDAAEKDAGQRRADWDLRAPYMPAQSTEDLIAHVLLDNWRWPSRMGTPTAVSRGVPEASMKAHRKPSGVAPQLRNCKVREYHDDLHDFVIHYHGPYCAWKRWETVGTAPTILTVTKGSYSIVFGAGEQPLVFQRYNSVSGRSHCNDKCPVPVPCWWKSLQN